MRSSEHIQTHYRGTITGLMLLLGIALAACGAPANVAEPEIDTFELSESEMIESGREIVEAQCSFCHATSHEGASPRPDAPPLRSVLASYAPDALAEDFREQVHVGHPDMPDFDFGPIGTDHVLAYLISIQDSQSADD